MKLLRLIKSYMRKTYIVSIIIGIIIYLTYGKLFYAAMAACFLPTVQSLSIINYASGKRHPVFRGIIDTFIFLILVLIAREVIHF